MRHHRKAVPVGELAKGKIKGGVSCKGGFLRQDTSSVVKLGFAIGLNDLLGPKRHSAALRVKDLICRMGLIKK